MTSVLLSLLPLALLVGTLLAGRYPGERTLAARLRGARHRPRRRAFASPPAARAVVRSPPRRAAAAWSARHRLPSSTGVADVTNLMAMSTKPPQGHHEHQAHHPVVVAGPGPDGRVRRPPPAPTSRCSPRPPPPAPTRSRRPRAERDRRRGHHQGRRPVPRRLRLGLLPAGPRLVGEGRQGEARHADQDRRRRDHRGRQDHHLDRGLQVRGHRARRSSATSRSRCRSRARRATR